MAPPRHPPPSETSGLWWVSGLGVAEARGRGRVSLSGARYPRPTTCRAWFGAGAWVAWVETGVLGDLTRA